MVDKTSSDSLILNIFFEKGYYLRWIAFFLSAYDEMTDQIILMRAFEVTFIIN
jgi:hypothetical protein